MSIKEFNNLGYEEQTRLFTKYMENNPNGNIRDFFIHLEEQA